MKLQVGQRYRDRVGRIVRVKKTEGNTSPLDVYTVVGTELSFLGNVITRHYMSDGKFLCNGDVSEFDLIDAL